MLKPKSLYTNPTSKTISLANPALGNTSVDLMQGVGPSVGFILRLSRLVFCAKQCKILQSGDRSEAEAAVQTEDDCQSASTIPN